MAILKQLRARDWGSTPEYLLGTERASDEPDYRDPRVLLGDPVRFKQFAATIPYAQPVTSLILSFEEALDDQRLSEHADALIEALCVGVPRTQFDALVVAHRERAVKKNAGWVHQAGVRDCIC